MTIEKYILDTNIVSYLYEDNSLQSSSVKEYLLKLPDGCEVYVSILTIYEIEYGVAVAEKEEIEDMFRKMKRYIVRDFPILPLAFNASEKFGLLKAKYVEHTGINKKAAKRHDIDFMIAGSALAHNAILVSSDGIFEQIQKIHPELLIENWSAKKVETP
jgi:predicted nucleic acid-binding protein